MICNDVLNKDLQGVPELLSYVFCAPSLQSSVAGISSCVDGEAVSCEYLCISRSASGEDAARPSPQRQEPTDELVAGTTLQTNPSRKWLSLASLYKALTGQAAGLHAFLPFFPLSLLSRRSMTSTDPHARISSSLGRDLRRAWIIRNFRSGFGDLIHFAQYNFK